MTSVDDAEEHHALVDRLRTFLEPLLRPGRSERAGRGPIVVFVHGPPASGKTPLLEQYRRTIDQVTIPKQVVALDWSMIPRQDRREPAGPGESPAPNAVLSTLAELVSEAGPAVEELLEGFFIEAMRSENVRGSIRLPTRNTTPATEFSGFGSAAATRAIQALDPTVAAFLAGLIFLVDKMKGRKGKPPVDSSVLGDRDQQLTATLAKGLDAAAERIGLLVFSLDSVDAFEDGSRTLGRLLERTGDRVVWLISTRAGPTSELMTSLSRKVPSGQVLTVQMGRSVSNAPAGRLPDPDLARHVLRNMDDKDVVDVLSLGLVRESTNTTSVTDVLDLDHSHLDERIKRLHETHSFVQPRRPWLDGDLRQAIRALLIEDEGLRSMVGPRNESVCRGLRQRLAEFVGPTEPVEQQVVLDDFVRCYDELLWHSLWLDPYVGPRLLEDALPALWLFGAPDAAGRLLRTAATCTSILGVGSKQRLELWIGLDERLRTPPTRPGPDGARSPSDLGLRHPYRSCPPVLVPTPRRQRLVDVLEVRYPQIFGLDPAEAAAGAHQLLGSLDTVDAPRLRSVLRQAAENGRA